MSVFNNKDKLEYFKNNVQGLDDQADFDPNQYYYNRDSTQSEQQQLQNGYNLDSYGQSASQLQRQQLQQQSLRNGSLVGQQEGVSYMNSAAASIGGSRGVGGLGGISLNSNSNQSLNTMYGNNGFNSGTNSTLGSRVISSGNNNQGSGSLSGNSNHQQQQQQFDSNNFPSLSAAGGSSMLLGGGSGRGYSAVAQLGASGLSRGGLDPDFSVGSGEDFPALPGANRSGVSDSVVGGSGNDSSKLVGGGLSQGSGGNQGQQQQQQANNMFSDMQGGGEFSIHQQQSGGSHPLLGGLAGSLGAAAHQPAVTKEQKFGLAGLLDVIRYTDKDINALALGTDLTTFGLNLNSSDSLYPSFSSPFTDTAQVPDPQFSTPACYMMHPPSLKSEHLSKFQIETLFYMFYAMPKDILQACAAQELYRRDWRYHAELRVWLKPRAPQELMQSHPNVQFVFFDSAAWETRLFTTAVRGNIAAGLLGEEEVRVKAPQANSNSNSIPLGAVGPQ